MLRDHRFSYCWLFAFTVTIVTNAARAITEWCAALSVSKGLMSDGPMHFNNETVRLVTKGLRVPHRLSPSYTSCTNGAVERLGKEIFRVFRAVTTEL